MGVYESSLLGSEDPQERQDAFREILDAAVNPTLEMCITMSELRKDMTVWDKAVFLINCMIYIQVCPGFLPSCLYIDWNFLAEHPACILIHWGTCFDDSKQNRSTRADFSHGACKYGSMRYDILRLINWTVFTLSTRKWPCANHQGY